LKCVSPKERERDTGGGEEGGVRENGETCTAKMWYGEIKKEMTKVTCCSALSSRPSCVGGRTGGKIECGVCSRPRLVVIVRAAAGVPGATYCTVRPHAFAWGRDSGAGGWAGRDMKGERRRGYEGETAENDKNLRDNALRTCTGKAVKVRGATWRVLVRGGGGGGANQK
jgi:hypothetical protein